MDPGGGLGVTFPERTECRATATPLHTKKSTLKNQGHAEPGRALGDSANEKMGSGAAP